MDATCWASWSRFVQFSRGMRRIQAARTARENHAARIAQLASRAASIPLTGGEGEDDGPSLFQGETYRYGESPTSHD